MKRFASAIGNKIRESRAFTLSEALVAVIILLFVTSIVVAGMPAAIRAYDNIVIASNSDVLLSTTMTVLRNELNTASKIELADKDDEGNYKSLVYYNEAYGAMSKISLSADGKDIMYEMYTNNYDLLKDAKGYKGSPVRLMSETVSDKQKELHVTYDSVTYSNGVVTFNKLTVNRRDGKTMAAQRSAYKIRVLTESTVS